VAKEIVTLYIDDSAVRLLVAQRNEVKKWAELPLEPGLVKDGVIVDETGVGDKIKELLTDQKVNAIKVITGLSGLHSLFRLITLPPLTKSLLADAVRLEAEKVMPVPLAQLYLSWQVIPTAADEATQVFLASFPRDIADTLIRTLRHAGLDPYLIDLKPLALARVVDRPTAIIADVQPTEIEIIVMVDRIPQLIRTVALPAEPKSRRNSLAITKEELEKTIKFYNTSHSDKPLDPDVTIFTSGDLAIESETDQFVIGDLKFPTMPLASPLKCPEGLPAARFMVNIALALKEALLPQAQANSSMINLNALPEPYRPKPRSLRELLFVPSVIVAIALLIPLIISVQNAADVTASLQDQLNTTNQLMNQKQLQKKNLTKSIAELENKVSQVEAAHDSFSEVLNNLAQQQEEVNNDLETVTSLLPDTIDLRNISRSSNGVGMTGIAPDEETMFEYATNLRASGIFSQVVISNIKKTADGMNFNLILMK